MAETHRLRAPDHRPASPEYEALNQEAERRGRECPAASMPSLDHLRRADYEAVYEPSDDTYLLIDGLGVEFGRGGPGCGHGSWPDPPRNASGSRVDCILEIGCGSGAATVFLADLLLRESSGRALGGEEGGAAMLRCYVTDINERATGIALRTSEANGQPRGLLEAVRCDLAAPLVDRLSGLVDVLIFNPPYVPTPDDEVGSAGIEASWAGGKDGRMVIDRALPQIARLLSWPHGRAYMITVDDNFPEQISAFMMKEYGVLVQPLVRRKANNEFLTVQKMTLTRKLGL